MKLNEFASINFNKLLPAHVVASRFRPDMEDDGPQVDHTLPRLFMESLPVAGCLHMISNASKDIDKSLKGWKVFYSSLKTIEKLVSSPFRLQRLVAQCIRGTEYDSFAARLAQAIPGLYDKRWGEVYKFCAELDKKSKY